MVHFAQLGRNNTYGGLLSLATEALKIFDVEVTGPQSATTFIRVGLQVVKDDSKICL